MTVGFADPIYEQVFILSKFGHIYRLITLFVNVLSNQCFWQVMLLTVNVLGQKVDVFVVDVLKVDVLEVVQMGWPDLC